MIYRLFKFTIENVRKLSSNARIINIDIAYGRPMPIGFSVCTLIVITIIR